jgi:5'-AMP-activated protein kinase regulatory beta subunit
MGNQHPSASGANASSNAPHINTAAHMGTIPGNPYGGHHHHHHGPSTTNPSSSSATSPSPGGGGGGGVGGVAGVGGGGGGGHPNAPHPATAQHHPNHRTGGTPSTTTTNNGGGGGQGAAPAGYLSAAEKTYAREPAARRIASDASMANMDDSDTNGNGVGTGNGGTSSSSTGGGGGGSNVPLDLTNLTVADDDTVPTVFRWEHGGRQVYITGTFNGWSRQIPMHRSGNDFTYIHNLKRGKHAFKFIVDDEWRFAPDQPTVADIEGRINNFIDVTDFKPYTGDKDFEREKVAAYYSTTRPSKPATSEKEGGGGGGGGTTGDADAPDPSSAANRDYDPDGEVFSHTMPDIDDYTKEPPPLPPHLRHIILNKPPQLQDTAALPVPQHVALNHLYCTAIKDNMMVLGITQRFKTKFVTTVYYSPELSR